MCRTAVLCSVPALTAHGCVPLQEREQERVLGQKFAAAAQQEKDEAKAAKQALKAQQREELEQRRSAVSGVLLMVAWRRCCYTHACCWPCGPLSGPGPCVLFSGLPAP
jgi:hypothetical protein